MNSSTSSIPNHQKKDVYDEGNLFARILRGELPCKKFLENDHALVFWDIYPRARVHLLAIPKGSYTNASEFYQKAPADMIEGFSRILGEICPTLGILSGQWTSNQGEAWGQEIFHFHVHFLSNELSVSSEIEGSR